MDARREKLIQHKRKIIDGSARQGIKLGRMDRIQREKTGNKQLTSRVPKEKTGGVHQIVEVMGGKSHPAQETGGPRQLSSHFTRGALESCLAEVRKRGGRSLHIRGA